MSDLGLLAAYIRQSTAARGVDLYAIDHGGYSIPEWAEATDRNRRNVRRNVDRARADLADE